MTSQFNQHHSHSHSKHSLVNQAAFTQHKARKRFKSVLLTAVITLAVLMMALVAFVYTTE